MKALAGVLLLMALPGASLAAVPWESTGPPGCEVRGIGQDASDPQTLFVGCFNAAYRSEDGGASWRNISDPRLYSVYHFEVAPSHPVVLYAATPTEILRSRDEGESWVSVSDGTFRYVRSLEVDPSDPNTVYACPESGLLRRTRDGGETWADLGVGCRIVAVSPHDPQVLYRSGWPFRRSRDGGQTWDDLPLYSSDATHATQIEFDPRDPSTVFAVAEGGLHRTRDNGATWEAVASGGAFAVRATSPYEIWAYFDGTMQISTDDGDTWNPSPANDEIASVSRIFLDPTEASRALVGTSMGLFETRDRANSWSRLENGLNATYIPSLASDPGGGAIFAGTPQFRGGLFRSRDSGTHWDSVAGEFRTFGVFGIGVSPSDPDLVMASFAGYSVCPMNCTLGFALESQDGGQTWATTLGPQPLVFNDFAIDPQTPTTAYAAGPGVWKKTDASGWSPLEGAVVFYASDVAIDLANPSTLFVATYQNGLWKSVDSGESFSRMTMPADGVLQVAIDPSDSDRVWTATNLGIFGSPNAGESWEDRTGGLPIADAYPSDVEVHPDWSENLFVSMRFHTEAFIGGVFESRDSGLTWQPLNDGLTSYFVNRLSFTRGGLFLHVATSGQGVFRLQLPFIDAQFGPYAPFVDALAAAGVTAGCGRRRFCTDDSLSRAQSSVMLLRSLEGSEYAPPAATGALFADVAADAFAAAWIEEIADRGITAGCGDGLFCPDAEVTRAQAAVLNLRTKNGDMYQPPPATGTMFDDVPASHYAAAWIEEFARQGYTAGCAPNLFCPEQSVSRGQMAVFLAGVFSLL